MQQGTAVAIGRKLQAYEPGIEKKKNPICWDILSDERNPLPKTNQLKLFISLLLFNYHWNHEATLMPHWIACGKSICPRRYHWKATHSCPSKWIHQQLPYPPPSPTWYLKICWLTVSLWLRDLYPARGRGTSRDCNSSSRKQSRWKTRQGWPSFRGGKHQLQHTSLQSKVVISRLTLFVRAWFPITPLSRKYQRHQYDS